MTIDTLRIVGPRADVDALLAAMRDKQVVTIETLSIGVTDAPITDARLRKLLGLNAGSASTMSRVRRRSARTRR